MDNVIFILVDSVFSECLGRNRTDESSTPFIDSLINEGLFADNVYSYAPYTDAATIGLYCGIPTLEKLGYYFGINIAENNHFKLFSERGYETIGLYYPYYLVSSKTKKYIDHVVYTGGFKYGSVWGGKLEYYAKEKENRELTNQEYLLIEKCMDLVFDSWLTFYKDIKESETARIIVGSLKTNEMKSEGESGLKEEYQKYLANKRQYIDELLNQGMNHRLAFLNDYDYGKEKDKQFLKDIYAENRRFFDKVQRVNFTKNIVNNPISIKKSLHSIKKAIFDRDKTYMRYIGNYGMLLAGCKLMEKRSLGKRDWQEVASLDNQINAMFKVLENRDDSKPFYASLHVLEPHHNVSFFSFDSFDKGLIKKEIEYLEPLVKNCGRKFSGNLLYQLSLRYVDFCIKDMFERLKSKGLLDNTTVVLVADHGTSYTFSPTRTKVVNTFHKENYNIPLLIWSKNLSSSAKGKYSGFFSSEDILPTLCKTLGLDIPEDYKGKVIFEEKEGRPYIITEYMGPGVPDMISREVWISIRNNDYVIAYKNSISRSLNKQQPFLIYDLNKDKLEENGFSNIEVLLEKSEVKNMINILEERFNVIKHNTSETLESLPYLKI